mmetsp:Transcript_45441/g.114362  ORF Transcript_45441/g.114362 Transcript_45441/m.114362 type:complete len:224 (-) Transcript_45441:29-700(-)
MFIAVAHSPPESRVDSIERSQPLLRPTSASVASASSSEDSAFGSDLDELDNEETMRAISAPTSVVRAVSFSVLPPSVASSSSSSSSRSQTVTKAEEQNKMTKRNEKKNEKKNHKENAKKNHKESLKNQNQKENKKKSAEQHTAEFLLLPRDSDPLPEEGRRSRPLPRSSSTTDSKQSSDANRLRTRAISRYRNYHFRKGSSCPSLFVNTSLRPTINLEKLSSS